MTRVTEEWSGSIITGSLGAEKLKFFTNLIDSQDLKNYNQYSSEEHFTFKPKMSHQLNYDKLKNISEVDAIFVRDLADLESRAGAFSDSMHNNLNVIHPREGSSQIVLVSPAKLREFEIALVDCLSYLGDLSSSWIERFKLLCAELVPIDSGDINRPLRKDGAGLSTHFYRKGIFLSLPLVPDRVKVELLLNLVHELGHQALFTYQRHDKIAYDCHRTPVFSAIRRTKRPLIQSIHAMVAIVYMLELIISAPEKFLGLGDQIYIKERFRGLIDDLKKAVEALDRVEFTKLGKLIYREAVAICLKSEMVYAKL